MRLTLQDVTPLLAQLMFQKPQYNEEKVYTSQALHL